MAESDTYTQRAVEALESAGFEKAQAGAIVTTVTAVTDERIAAIVGNLATKDQVEALASKMESEIEAAKEQMATKEQVEALNVRMEAKATKEQVEALITRMEAEARTTKERLAATVTKEELKSTATELRAEIAIEFKELYRHLWIMSASIVALTVTLVKLIP